MQATLEAPIVRLVPTIKGIFVNSHVEAVRRQLGPGGVAELERRFGRALDFRAGEDVPVRDEVRLIEQALDLTTDYSDPEQRAFEAGRLHFRNFSTTPYARVLFTLFPRNFRFLVLHAKTVAERVFHGVQFDAVPLGPDRVQLLMTNADYPIQHFRGLFHEWMGFFGLRGAVTAEERGHHQYVYVLEWSA